MLLLSLTVWEKRFCTGLFWAKVSVLTCEVVQTLAGVTALSAAAPPVVFAGSGIAQVDFGLAVLPSETHGTAAAKAVDGVDGSEQDGVGGDEGRRAVKLQHRHTLHVVLARLSEADVVVEG